MDYQGTERMAHERYPTSAHCMVKIGLAGDSVGFGTVRTISLAGFEIAYEYAEEHSVFISNAKNQPVIIIGTEQWNRHFSIYGNLIRITRDGRIACSINSTTSDAFLREWVRREQR